MQNKTEETNSQQTVENPKDLHLQQILAQIEKNLEDTEAEEVLDALKETSATLGPITLRILDPPLPFQSSIVIRNNHVLILKPSQIAPFIHKNSMIILDWMDIDKNAGHEYLIAMEVVLPELRINDRQSAMVCQIPKAFLIAQNRQRLLQRHDVDSYNWKLHFPKKRTSFHLTDITRNGLAFRAHSRFHSWFMTDRIYNGLYLKWEGQEEIKIIFFRVRQIEGDKISGRIGLHHHSLEKLNEWLQFLD